MVNHFKLVPGIKNEILMQTLTCQYCDLENDCKKVIKKRECKDDRWVYIPTWQLKKRRF